MQAKIIGIICKDAGAANQVAYYTLNNPSQYIFALQEPAQSIFSSVLGQITNLNLEEVTQLADEIISGSGWTSDFELEGIQMALRNGKRTITHLDHWNNYLERFSRHSKVTLPDEFWVSDDYSMNIATKLFRNTKIVKKKDYYLQHQVRTIRNLKSENLNSEHKKLKNILFLSEPLINYASSGEMRLSDKGYLLKMEFISLIENAAFEALEIRIRPHPNERTGQMKSSILDHPGSASWVTPLSTDLAWADVVIGIDSYALFVSDNADIPTISIACWAGVDVSIPKGRIRFLQRNELIEFLRAI